MRTVITIWVLFFIVLIIPINGYGEITAKEEQLKILRSARVVRIVVEQPHFLNIYYFPFEKMARGLLKYAGLKICEINNRKYDATLEIKVDAEAICDVYEVSGKKGQYCFGAEIYGTIRLESSRSFCLRKVFSWTI